MTDDQKKGTSASLDYFDTLTGDISGGIETPGPSEDVGERIAAIRKERGLSLEKLSEMTGFSVDTLSAIENNTIQPQLGTIMRLSKALDSALTRLISGQGTKSYEITRRGERKPISRSTSGKGQKKLYSYQGLAADVHGRNMEPLLVELEPEEVPEVSVHEGEEFIFVLSGTALLRIGEESFDLEPGDSAYYLSTTPHAICGKDGKATILAVLYE
ncbi:MAG: helix-turn-helix transcriptional regulator [Deltaproteobacteria bacterium]|nr:helix-turn-helix transcriptional regulator [Deltaproteobacteria bacterium]